MKIITVCSDKGGVSKSSVCQALIEELRDKKYKVLSIDMDQQGNLTDCTNADNNKNSIYDLLTNKLGIDKIIQRDSIKSSDQIVLLKDNVNPVILRNKLKPISNKYDFCIIDTAPKHDKTMIMALMASDYVIIPTLADSFSYKGVIKTIKIINDVREHNNGKPTIAGILFNMYSDRNILSKQIKQNMDDKLSKKGIYIFKTTISKSIAIPEAQASRVKLSKYAPNAKAVINYKTFVKELLEILKNK